MKKYCSFMVFVVAFFSFLTVLYPASWSSLNGPYGGVVQSLYVNPNNQVYAEFAGKLWTSADLRNWVPIFQDCSHFMAGRDNTLFVQDSKNNLFFSTDWGAAWQEIPKMRNDLALERMAFGDGGRWYLAAGNQVLLSTDGGRNWTPFSFSFNNSAEKVRVDETGNLYVFGNSRLFISLDQGQTWRQIYSAYAEIQDVLAAGSMGLFLVVGTESGGQILKSTDRGSSWVASNLPYAKTLAYSDSWLMGAFGKRGSLLNAASFISSNSGASWRMADVGYSIRSFAHTGDGKLLAASVDGLWVSADGGINWTIVGPPAADVRNIAGADWGIFAVSRTADEKLRFWVTRNNGVSWSEVEKSRFLTEPRSVLGLQILPDGRLWMMLGYSSGTDRSILFESRDRGASWIVKRKSVHPISGFDFLASTAAAYLWEAGTRVYYYSSDYGAAWIPVSLPFPIYGLLTAQNGILYAFSGSDVNRPLQLFRSFSAGSAWDPPISLTEQPEMIYSLQTNFLGDLFKTVARQNADGSFAFVKLLRSIDFGDTWQDISPSAAASLSSSVPPQLLTDAGGALYLLCSKVFKSNANGDRWEIDYEPANRSAEANILFVSNETSTLLAGLKAGGVSAKSLSGKMFVPKGLAEVEYPITKSYGVYWTDYNSDGFEDVFILNDGQNEFYHNDSGKLKKVTSGEIVTDPEPSRAAVWGDYNNDGYPDCYVANSGVGNCLYKNLGDGTFKKITLGNVVEDRGNFKSCAWGDVNRDGFLDLYLTRIDGRNLLYLNTGTGYFEKSYVNLIGENTDKSYGCAWCDFDNDGDLDLYVCNDGLDQLWEQVSPMKFAQLSQERLPQSPGLSVGCSWADVNNDGWMDLFVTMAGAANRLYLNNGNGSFRLAGGELSLESGAFKGSGFADYDNDGDLDLAVTGNGVFRLYENREGVFQKENRFDISFFGDNSLALAWGDLENDGKLELIVGSYDRKNVVYSPSNVVGNWIRVKCVGTASNRQALGAKVVVKAVINGKAVMQTRELTSQSGYLAQSSLIQHFGLGDAQRADSIIVIWPNGKRQTTANVAVNQIVTITEAGGAKVEDEAFPEDFSLLRNYPNPFNSTTTIRFAVRHKGETRVEILNIHGRILRRENLSKATPGIYEWQWDGRDSEGKDCPSGVYFIRIVTTGGLAFGKAMLVR
ncbi:MAG: FG-GAP-like repeat-containing protein [candidate division KSB1 bacterium]|nr:FG-GAP-like repeat-containing protein [candidate division KSB1 bacterium]